jgi:pilus assembly protein CpaE
MHILIASNHEPVSNGIRELLERQGYDPVLLQVLCLDDAVDRVVQFCPELVVLVLPDDPEQGFAVLHEILDMVQTRVMVVGPASDPKLILRMLREGAYRYIDESELETEFTESLARLRRESPIHSERGRVITVMGPCGGSGTSTLAVNIATVLATASRRCALFDLNLDTGDLSALLKLDPSHTVADFCRHVSRMDQTMFEQCFIPHATGIHLLAAPHNYTDLNTVTSRGVRKALTMARTCFPYVVVDLGGSYRDEYAQAIYQADVILLVLRLEFASLRQASRRLEYLQELGVPKDRVRLVANRYRQPKELRLSDVERVLERKVTYFVPEDPRNVNRANNKGVPVVLERPSAKSSRSIVKIAQSVNGVYHPVTEAVH